MVGSFVLRAAERGYNKLLSTGPNASYVAGHPDAFITRYSSFNFHEYQSGRPRGSPEVRTGGAWLACRRWIRPSTRIHDFAPAT